MRREPTGGRRQPGGGVAAGRGAAGVDVIHEMLAVLERPLQQVAASGVRPSTTQVTASRLPVNAAE